MGLPRACTVMEQNANMVAGVQIDTAIYVGTGTAAAPSGVIGPLRVGREAPVYILNSIQTAAAVEIILDTVNAYAGASISVRFGTGCTGTSTMRLVNATTGGTVISSSTAGQAPVAVQGFSATFDGAAWR